VVAGAGAAAGAEITFTSTTTTTSIAIRISAAEIGPILEVETVLQPYLLGAATLAATGATGNTARSIAAAHRIVIARPLNGLAAPRVAIRSRNAERVPNSELASRAGTWAASATLAVAWGIGPAAWAQATAWPVPGPPIAPVAPVLAEADRAEAIA